MDSIKDIRDQFRFLKVNDIRRGNTIEIQNAQFLADEHSIFGEPNTRYIEAELEWYKSKSLNVYDLFHLYNGEVKIWKQVADLDGRINSNYGWCVFSGENGAQYENVLTTLDSDSQSRQAVMIYTRPDMHTSSKWNGMKDFMCTTHVQYFINGNLLDCSVYMRSNDAVFGFMNDVAWQRYVLMKLALDLGVQPGEITWNAGSLHIYDRHYELIS